MMESSVWFTLKTGKRSISDDRRVIEEVVNAQTGQLTSFNMSSLADVRQELHMLFDEAIEEIIKMQKLNPPRQVVKIESAKLEKFNE